MKKVITRRIALGIAGGTIISGGSLIYARQVEPAWLDVTSHSLSAYRTSPLPSMAIVLLKSLIFMLMTPG